MSEDLVVDDMAPSGKIRQMLGYLDDLMKELAAFRDHEVRPDPTLVGQQVQVITGRLAETLNQMVEGSDYIVYDYGFFGDFICENCEEHGADSDDNQAMG